MKEENIIVVYNGISSKFNHKKITKEEKKKIIKKYKLPVEYVLCLSTLEPRKNLRLMLQAYQNLYRKGYIEEIVLAGRKGWKMDDFLKGFDEDFLEHVHFSGFIDDNDLPYVYKLAKVFVFPSMYEGFGIPPLEAIACGTSVISSDAAAMPEILKDNALYFESNNCDSLENSIIEFDRKKSHNTVDYDCGNYDWNIQAKVLYKFITKKKM